MTEEQVQVLCDADILFHHPTVAVLARRSIELGYNEVTNQLYLKEN